MAGMQFAVIGGQQLTINDLPVLTHGGSLKQTYVPLKAGYHSFGLVGDTQDGYMRFSWMTLDGQRVLPEGTKDADFVGTTRWQCYRPLKGSLFYKK